VPPPLKWSGTNLSWISAACAGKGIAGKFHFKTIPQFCYKVDVTTAHLGDVKLAYPHEDGDQWVVGDVVGGSTLWNERSFKAA
jgi:hypothetical protein